MKKVYTLYRVSTKGQVDKDDIPMQRIICREFAEKQGWTIVKEFMEKGVSGFKVSSDDRDAIQDLRTAAENHEFDILLVFMFDRIGRRENETPFVVEWFVNQGIEVWSAKEGEQRFDTHVDKLTNYIRYWQASGESQKTSIRISTRLEQLTEDGIYTGRTIPFGYRLVKKGRTNKKGNEMYDVEVDATEAIIVRDIFLKVANEGYGSYRLMKYLKDQGIRTHKGSYFNSATINRLLKNKMVCGYFISGKTISSQLPELQIIDEHIFEQVQEILKARADKDNTKRQIALNTKSQALLSGIVFCAHCGNRLTVTRYKDKRIRADGSLYQVDELKYLCYHKSRNLCSCDGCCTYKAGLVDEVVENILFEIFQQFKDTPKQTALEQRYQAQIAMIVAQKREQTLQLQRQQTQLKGLEEQLCKALVGESPISLELIANTEKSVKAKIQELETSLSEIDEQLESKRKAMTNLSECVIVL